MNLPIQIIRRKVKRVRLEYTADGLKVILPLRFSGDIQDLLLRHKPWIERRVIKMARLKEQLKSLEFIDRSETQFYSHVSQLVKVHGLILGVAPKQIKYRRMSARWGSCNKYGLITFNKKLQTLPEQLVEYVVVHELCHLRHMNHSSHFWIDLGKVLPDYKLRRQQIKLYGFALNS